MAENIVLGTLFVTFLESINTSYGCFVSLFILFGQSTLLLVNVSNFYGYLCKDTWPEGIFLELWKNQTA